VYQNLKIVPVSLSTRAIYLYFSCQPLLDYWMDGTSYECGSSEFSLLGITIGEMLKRTAAKYPDNEALVSVHQNIRWTYREFLEKVDDLARALMGIGVEQGDHVGIWALNCAEWVLVQFATAKIGAVLVNINPAYRTHEFEYAAKQSEISNLFIQGRFKASDYVGMFYETCPEASESEPGQIECEKFPFLRKVIFMGDVRHDGMYTWDEFLEKGGAVTRAELEERELSLDFDDAINIQYTSGTTGFPKAVVLTHHNILNNGYSIG